MTPIWFNIYSAHNPVSTPSYRGYLTMLVVSVRSREVKPCLTLPIHHSVRLLSRQALTVTWDSTTPELPVSSRRYNSMADDINSKKALCSMIIAMFIQSHYLNSLHFMSYCWFVTLKLILNWNAEGELVKSTFTSHTGWVTCLAWSPVNEHLFMSGSYDTVVKLWDTRR